jgi:hypothetical protein
VRLARLDFPHLPDDRLLQAFQRGAMSGAGVATLAAAREIVSRESITDGVDQAYRQLIRSEPDPDRALEWADQAKARAAQAGKPGGQWAILQLEVQIERGDAIGVQSTLDEIRRNHLNEPGVADATYQLLYSAGLLVPRGAGGGVPPGAMPPGGGSPLATPSPASEPSRLWTPGQDAPAPAGGGKSALWTP